MTRYAAVLYGLLTGALAGTSPARAGWVIDQVVQEAGEFEPPAGFEQRPLALPR